MIDLENDSGLSMRTYVELHFERYVYKEIPLK